MFSASILCVHSNVMATVPAMQPLSIEADAARIQQVMDLYEKRQNIKNHTQAAQGFSTIAKAHPHDIVAQLWCARTAYYSAHRYQENKTMMKRLARLGHECGERLQPFAGVYEADLWMILSRFKLFATSGWIPPLGKIEKLTRQLQRIAEKNPKRYATYLLLGAIFRELPGWPLSIGDDKLAMRYLKKGEKLAPNNAELLLELAATYTALNQKDIAKAVYERCIRKGTGAADLQFETQEARKWAKTMLGEL